MGGMMECWRTGPADVRQVRARFNTDLVVRGVGVRSESDVVVREGQALGKAAPSRSRGHPAHEDMWEEYSESKERTQRSKNSTEGGARE